MGDARPVSVAIVNDYEVVVAGVARLLEPYADRVRVVELDANTEPEQPVDIALYDTFAAEHGPETQYRRILSAIGAGRLVVYAWQLDEDLVKSALAAGASGYLSKRLDADALAEAIVRVDAGEIVVTGETPAEDEDTGGDWPGKDAGLSERESEVLALIAQGFSNDQVANRAYLSINTIKTHIRTAYRKIGVTSRSQAVLWAVDHGFRKRVVVRRDDDAL